MEFTKEFEACRAMVEERLNSYFQTDCPQRPLLESMRYSLLAGGKRIRPVLVLKFCQAAGGEAESALPFACGVEMLHTYSLIHDDLPCMDNDSLRRGKPTNHVVYGECTATLAGDALQAAAFETALTAPLPADRVVRGVRALAEAAGAMGICGGQYLDMDGEGRALTLEEITAIHQRKTAALLTGAALMGVYAAGRSEGDEMAAAAAEYAAGVGLAFQIRDDILDCTSTTEQLGKPVGSDAENGKSTFVTRLGMAACKARIAEETARAKAALVRAFPHPEFLCAMADWLAGRRA